MGKFEKILKKVLTFAYNGTTLTGMKGKKVKMGRPPKAPAEKYSAQVNIHMRQAERVRLDAEAKKRGLSLSALLMCPWREKMAKEPRQDCAGKAQRRQVD